MKRLTVISHFYNEEYLLPWWLNHHKEIFDHGILINYASTDNSLDIIKSICPSWDVYDSKNLEFAHIAVNDEVMEYEQNIEGYKICLNTTEFLIDKGIKNEIDYESKNCYPIRRATMVDINPEENATYDKPLVDQKNDGFLGENGINGEYRYVHNYENGNYDLGRHDTFLNKKEELKSLILWYGFSPWTLETKKRKFQIKYKIPKKDALTGAGWQHFLAEENLEAMYIKNCLKTLCLKKLSI